MAMGRIVMSGAVRDAGGSPLAGVDVQWYGVSGDSAITTSGSDGSYSVTITADDYIVYVNWFPLGSCCFAIGTSAGPVTVDHDATVNVTMPAVVPVTVTVVDGASHPVPG